MSGLVRLSPPQAEPVTLAEAKAQLRLEHDAEDALIAGLISAAREAIEVYLRRALIAQRWQMTLDAWPQTPVRLPKPPLMSVEAVRVIGADGAAAVMAPEAYRVESRAEPGFVMLKPAILPPLPGQPRDGIEIDFTAGYGDSWNMAPAPVRQALLAVVSELYETRGAAPPAIAGGVRSLLEPYRMMSL